MPYRPTQQSSLHSRLGIALVCLAGAWTATTPALAQELIPRNAYDTRLLPRAAGKLQIEVIDNSPTLSQALKINASGAIIGVREATNDEQTIFSMTYFYCDDKSSVDLPQLKGYTNVEATGLSDNGLVVGYASRPIGRTDGTITAIVWNSKTGVLTDLGKPGDYAGSHAQDISADGSTIVGYATGSDPARMKPCVWTLAGDQKWQATVVNTLHEYNPFIQASRVIISPNGKRIAACCTTEVTDNRILGGVFFWDLIEGQWTRKALSDDSFFLRDINDAGLIVGCVSGERGLRFPCFLDNSGKLKRIDLLPGDESGEANGVAADGTIVGFSDDPHGPEGGPQAFRWKNGKTEPIELGDAPYSAVYSINEAGQIAGLIDIVIESATPDAAPAEKTLAFRSAGAPEKQVER
ncbi:MAG: hypothetical protein R3C53_20140 [Pirellulaceae bacterium]